MQPRWSERTAQTALLSIILQLASGFSFADGLVVDRVYDPYVQPLETELEWRALVVQDKDKPELDGLQVHRLGVGYGFTDRWFGEIYLIGSDGGEEEFEVEAVELEAKWQLTEQGEYAADWGLLFELERETGEDQWEGAATLLALREWGRWVGTANLAFGYEWGERIDNEWESELRLQGRYRLQESFEPALEFYAGEDYRGLGPIARGSHRFSDARRLTWEFGVILGLTDDSPDQSWRLLVEYEFF
ncbi:hypothetical protein AUP74_00402 [Microbulbifer aggregans]|uniref:Cellulose biosynthesis protein BcsS n=1 Tax=Microbulbifer aggregans TaxID=1769779 RepID=A0A1C9W3Z9_9GAMM|nr:hypothetical protein [Microbulbifer aggregans]AOS95873.1 hypothetical protein AUP74_00402 [Microbulbifer aggregans]